MKVKIYKKIRITTIIALTLVLCISSVLLYKEYKAPKYKDEKYIVYNYGSNSNISYQVLMKPNTLNDGKAMGEDSIYITAFIDQIKAFYEYRFSGDLEASIQGSYDVIAEVEGFSGEGETYKTIWKKAFVLHPKKPINVTGNEVIINKEVPISLEPYNLFTAQLIEASKIQSSVKLTVTMNVDLTAETAKGKVTEKMTPSLVIPLGTDYFEIIKQQQEKPGMIEETKKVQIPVNQKLVIILGSIIGLMLIASIYVIFFTVGTLGEDPYVKALKKILKNHGSRLVALHDDSEVTGAGMSMVKSIDDLVKIADELCKPIIYRYSPEYEKISKFYISDNNTTYLFDLRKAFNKSMSEAEKIKVEKLEKLEKKDKKTKKDISMS